MRNVLSILFIVSALSGYGSVIVVGKGHLESFKKALSDAAPGDTILVKPGTYYINRAVIDKPVTVIGENYPVFHGAGKFELLYVTGSDINIQGIHFTHSGYSAMNDYAAVTVVDANNFVIKDNRFTHTFFGLHIANSHHFAVQNNTFRGVTKTEQTTGNGIHLWKCSHALIENNNASGHRDGIYFEFVTDSDIRKNESHHNIRYGLHFMFSNNDIYSDNVFRDNGAGVAVMFSRHVTMNGNTFSNNWGPSAYGLLLKEISDSRITHNLFHQNTVAIYMEGSNRIRVLSNVFRENGWASRVQASCSDNEYHDNNFLSNTFDIATNGSLVLNNFNGNYWDKYEGYDMNRDGVGDIPYRPVSMYSMLIEQNANSLLFLRSFMVTLLDKAEKAIPSLTPENLRDDKPFMKRVKL